MARHCCMAASHGCEAGNGGGAKGSSGPLVFQAALWTGLLTVWYCGANRDSTWSSARSRAPVRRTSSSVLPPRRRAASAKDGRCDSVLVDVLMRKFLSGQLEMAIGKGLIGNSLPIVRVLSGE